MIETAVEEVRGAARCPECPGCPVSAGSRGMATLCRRLNKIVGKL